jgi:hypothetical protein
MNLIRNDDGDKRNHEQSPRWIQRSLVRAVIILAAFSLAFLGALGLTPSAHPSNLRTASSYLMYLMSLALMLISVRWLPSRFSTLRCRIGVVLHFGGVLTFLIMIELSMFGIERHESYLHFYLWLVFAFIGMYLTIFLGEPILAQYRAVGAVWLRTGSRLDERELHMRQRALAMTCQILVVATVLAGIFLFWFDSRPWVGSTHSSVVSLLLLTYIGSAGFALPSAILAWTEPEPSSADS